MVDPSVTHNNDFLSSFSPDVYCETVFIKLLVVSIEENILGAAFVLYQRGWLQYFYRKIINCYFVIVAKLKLFHQKFFSSHLRQRSFSFTSIFLSWENERGSRRHRVADRATRISPWKHGITVNFPSIFRYWTAHGSREIIGSSRFGCHFNF